ncbi:proline dehydrogenase family protein [Paenibacillus soyae]|uniref:proline dehydrogenase n=1 Tax=Paenibacillus soyae TaxID=2969249 RepID=A0A9X2SDD3_9BACL|nr:proline dehydrogenase family protein [Paenibacillus soyae]MCR2807007.1 proline dehydrogenase family protein [Paenibacillus soyae]
MLRTLFLALGKNKNAARFMRRYGTKMGADRFVAGTELQEAVAAVKRLNVAGLEATLDHLGEFVRDERDAKHAAGMCLKTLETIHAEGLRANLSLKLTSLGLDIDPRLCERYMRTILSRARELQLFVRIDMEDYGHCQPAIDLYRKLKRDFPNVGIVLQAYLRRTERDVRELGREGANLRLVKGAYRESPQVAFPDKRDVDASFAKLIRRQLKQGYAAIATHDEAIIGDTLEWLSQNGISRERYEFQMLFGIREDLQRKLAKDGHRVRVYVPYGKDWFGYFMRRLAERPANAWFLLKHIRRKK